MFLKTWHIYLLVLLILIISVFSYTYLKAPDREVIIYTSVDQMYSEPILDRFEKETGIKVRAVYDVEAAKTTGLVNRLIAEKNNPLCDVWWSGEIVQTILLKDEGVLAPYVSPNAEGIPSTCLDPDGYWTGFGGRARVCLINTELLDKEDYPSSIYDFLDEKYPPDKIAIAYPVFGTTATHAAALYAKLGPEEAYSFFAALRGRGIRVVDGNGVVRDLVASGEAMFGLTDTDDSIGAIKRGAPVEMVFLDQGEDEMGTLIIPNTVAMVKGGPNEDEAKLLIDYLLSEETVRELVKSGWFQLPLRDIDVDQEYFDVNNIKGMDVNYSEIYRYIEQAKREMAEIFVR
ncbi:MAG: extracellular solute-binding protein [Armatimonadetes bacterium]|nr:extracellular solute-binding protein [Armatimonadota bacterium]